MRMWHKDLIDVLPRKQLTTQWRELCYIVKRVGLYGTPNHVLVNPVMDFLNQNDRVALVKEGNFACEHIEMSECEICEAREFCSGWGRPMLK